MPVNALQILALLVLLSIAVWVFYPRILNFFLFYPQTSLDMFPGDFDLPFEDVYFKSEDDRRLHGWFIPSKPDDGPVILFCHGNAGNISHRLENVQLLVHQNLSVFIFDYRGYGKSDGKPSVTGIYRDGLAAYDHLCKERQIQPEQIIPFGRSLGGAVAIEIALRRKVQAVIIESTFTSTKDMARTITLFRLFAPLVPTHLDNLKKIQRINVPILIVHGEQDKLVPFTMGKELFHAARAPKYFYPLPTAGHNDTYVVGGPPYFARIVRFAEEARL
jgi:fermentation-respiration switch protein FrsA (DUF1100 family)